jgi:PAS domain S-box-containing protein
MSADVSPDEVPEATPDVDAELFAYRQSAASALLGVLTVFGTVLVFLYLPMLFETRAWGVIAMSFGLIATSLLLALRPHWPLRLRVGWMVASLLLAAVPNLLTAGDRGVAAANLLGAVLTTGLLLGTRAGAVVLGLVGLGLASLAWGFQVGALPLPSVAQLASHALTAWVGLWLSLTEMAVLGLVGVHWMDERVRGLLVSQHQSLRRLSLTNAALTRARAERDSWTRALADTLSAVRTGLWELDLETGEMRWSSEFQRLIGCDGPLPDGSTRARLEEHIHPDDRARLASAFLADRAEVDLRSLPDAGPVRWLRLTASSTALPGGGRKVRGLLVDVTDERANARQLHRLAEVASRTGNAVIVTDLEGRIEWVNEAFTRSTGWLLSEVEGKSPGSVLQTEHTDRAVRARMARAIAAREPFDCEVLNVARDGRQYWVQIECRVIRDDTGAATGFVAVETDVTERRIAERRDRLAERVAALLLASESTAEAATRLVTELVAELDIRTAQFWLVEPGQSSLVYVAGARAEIAGQAGTAFLDATRALSFRAGRDFVIGVGVPGTAWGTRATAVLPIMASVGSRRLEAANAAGVVSFCGVPVHGPNGVLAVVEVGGTAMYPGHALLPNLLERIAEQVAAFLLHDASRRAFRTVFDRSPDGLLIVASDGAVQDANARALALFSDPVHQRVDGLLEGGAGLVEAALGTPAQDPQEGALLVQRAAHGVGGTFSAEVSVSSVAVGGALSVILAVRDLTERHRMEAAVTASLREKETLLKEIHHRVKNNLQIVSSLLSLQAEELEPGASRDALRETVFRVRSMSQVHQQLYGTENLNRIDFGAYTQTLCASLVASLDPRAVLELDVVPIEVTVDTAVPCGLALNELVTNALKHGRGTDGSCRLTVRLYRQEGWVVLSVSDRGPGFSPEATRAGSLGMLLLQSLARQLSGELVIGREGGAQVALRMRLDEADAAPVASA